MPKVRDSSGTIGTTFLPMALSFTSAVSMRTKAIVVEISRPSPVASSSGLNVSSLAASRLVLLRRRCGSGPPSFARTSRRYFISGESAAGLKYGISASLSSAIGMLKRSRNWRSASIGIFFCWWAMFLPSPTAPMP